MIEPEKIGVKLKIAREYARLTQKELAERISIKQTSISRYETGKVIPTLLNLAKITKILGMRIEDLAQTPTNK